MILNIQSCYTQVLITAMIPLRMEYLVGTGHQYFNAEADVGPTEGGSSNDIPIPDCYVGFDDLMIFSPT